MAVIIKQNRIFDKDIIEISGRLVNIDSEKFQRIMSEYVVKLEGDAVIDISDVNFIDSFGLGILIQYHTVLSKKNKKLILLNTNPDADSYLKRLFALTGLNKVFTIVDSVDKLVDLTV